MQARQHNNSQRILRTLYHNDAISRAQLARLTGLTRPTVSSLVDQLIAADLIVETGVGVSTGGKRPILLSVRQDASLMLCVDLSAKQYRGALLNLRGEIVVTMTQPAANATGEAAIQQLLTLIEQLMEASTRPILGISIGSPGLVDLQHGVVRQSLHLQWRDVQLKERLHTHFHVPVYIANDSHIAALAEYSYSTKHQQCNVILLKIGRGVSAGIVWNDAIFSGDGFGAGEIGQLVASERNGQLLTLEQVANQDAIMARAKAQLSAKSLTWQQLLDSPISSQIAADVGATIGRAIASLVAILNINTIVLSGQIIDLGPPLLSAIRQTARQHTLATLVDHTTITFSELGADAVLLGCSAQLLKHELGVF